MTAAEAFEDLEAGLRAISLEAYGVEWIDHVEYALWHALIHGPMRYGRLEIDDHRLAEIRRLSEACDGWVTRDREGVLHRLPRAHWQDRFAANVDLLRMDAPVPPPF